VRAGYPNCSLRINIHVGTLRLVQLEPARSAEPPTTSGSASTSAFSTCSSSYSASARNNTQRVQRVPAMEHVVENQ
jgi:hypothetical protein